MNGDGASGMGNSHSADPNGGFAFFWLKEDLPNLMNDGSDKIMRWTNGDGGLGLGDSPASYRAVCDCGG